MRIFVAAATLTLGLSAGNIDAAADPRVGTSQQRECFAEGHGSRHCVDLILACGPSDIACLMDDLSGAILRARGDVDAKYPAYLARGTVALRAGRLVDALADFEAAQSLQPRLVTPYILIGKVWLAAGEPRRALTSLDEANRRAPELPMVLMQRAAVRQALSDLTGAIDDLTRAIDIARSGRPLPEGAEEAIEVLLTARGAAYLAAGDHQRARADAEAALALAGGHAGAQALLDRIGRS